MIENHMTEQECKDRLVEHWTAMGYQFQGPWYPIRLGWIASFYCPDKTKRPVERHGYVSANFSDYLRIFLPVHLDQFEIWQMEGEIPQSLPPK